ncbi:alpha/beta fold hydrolase [Ramlibacter sp. H39-3-26]|uniref:alpha/beta hydrolase n=1 Tax=Curvibacter soli TaxID=3031331 RepID=UPI0023DC1EB7|nr:alpha/beta fold hydrolase [Ramlibacter sp. H39-3-26]MDF1484434.1 alpha/beta fold hydrolase [Ramlibacter sp. H39-3-26]
MKRWHWPVTLGCCAVAVAALAGCATLDDKQREWIFQPSDTAWGNSAADAEGMDGVWIDFHSQATGQDARLHALWIAAAAPAAAEGTDLMSAVGSEATAILPGGTATTTQASAPLPPTPAQTPVLLYLHGARWNVEGSSGRMRRMQQMGFSVLAIDYRGFGKSSPGLPSEATAAEDARAAWDWLATKYPGRPRYIFGHSLGGAIAIDLASSVRDEAGVMVEGTFTSISDVVSSYKWGWLPLSPLITQRFDSQSKVRGIGSPLLVVHGTNDSTIPPSLGRKLFDAATGRKQFLLVEGGSHFNTNAVGQSQYRQAITQLFGMR